jgi:hypothetical protein
MEEKKLVDLEIQEYEQFLKDERFLSVYIKIVLVLILVAIFLAILCFIGRILYFLLSDTTAIQLTQVIQ